MGISSFSGSETNFFALVIDNGWMLCIISRASPIFLLLESCLLVRIPLFQCSACCSEDIWRKIQHVIEGNNLQCGWMVEWKIKTKCSPRWRIVWRWLLQINFLFDCCCFFVSLSAVVVWLLEVQQVSILFNLGWWIDWFVWDTVQYLDEKPFWWLMNGEAKYRNWWWTIKSIDKLVE